MRSGAKIQYYFSVKSGLLTKITSDTRKTRVVLDDYRTPKTDGTTNILEPHRLRMTLDGAGELTLLLQSVKYDTASTTAHSIRRARNEKFDSPNCWRSQSQPGRDRQTRLEFAFTQTETDRELNSKGELKKQTVKVYEVFRCRIASRLKTDQRKRRPALRRTRGEGRQARDGRVRES
jgi:hypothetical protein